MLLCLVVDDVRPYRELLHHWLDECGYECVLAADAKVAWTKIEEQPFDLIITDIDMPKISGVQLIRRVRAADCPVRRAMPIVAISSQQDDSTETTIRQAGANQFIAKPLDKTHLLDTVDEAVHGRAD